MIARVMFRFVFAVVLTLLFAAFEAAAAPEGAGLTWSAPGEVPRAAASLSLDVIAVACACSSLNASWREAPPVWRSSPVASVMAWFCPSIIGVPARPRPGW